MAEICTPTKSANMSWLSVLENIGKDIEIGIEAAGPIITTFIPAAGPILVEIATIIADLENIGAAPNQAMASSLTQAAAQISAVKQASIAKSGGS